MPQCEFVHVSGGDNLEKVRELFREYADSLGVDLSFQAFEEELNALPGKYAPPQGSIIIATVDGKAAGCIALRRISDGICEMKRLYVRDAYRGLGIGRKLACMLVNEARDKAYRYMRLDTLATMKAAQGMYYSLGFREIEPYVYNPIEGTKFLELKL